MIILRQKSYSWSEIGKAAKHISRGALIGGIGGGAIGMKQLTNNNNPKGFLLRTGIGAALGAGLGAKVYATDYRNRKKWEKEEPHKKEVDEIVEKNFKWALDYLKGIDEKIEQENKKLSELGKKLLPKSKYNHSYFYDNFLFLVRIYNNYDYLSEYIADLSENPDEYLTPDGDRYIVYNESTNQLELVEGGKLITPIKNISSLRSVIKKYYSDSILSKVKYAINHPEEVGIDYGEYALMYNDKETTEEEYYKALDVYCKEIEKFIKTL